ncbi:MAG: RNA methyltransferase [Cyanobacteriota bacterium]|nr:RNA methyltransferase [Cyanobacteriota bacterium]HCA61062.1 RNA methyltransferase [Synechococcales bacterium UBA8647]
MPLPRQILISELLRSRLRDELGQDLGVGHQVWMHPPCHRLLGWSSRPSAFGPRRSVWRLDQLVDWLEGQVEVEGEPADTEQPTLDLLPTLMEATLLGQQQQPLGRLVDAVVDVQSGRINHYLVARSDPRLPGSSRWRLEPDRLIDQQPGQVQAALQELDDLPLDRASIRQQMLRRSRQIRDQVPDSFDDFEGRLRSFGQRLWDGGEDLIERWRDEEPPVDERRRRPRSGDWDDPDDGEDPWI